MQDRRELIPSLPPEKTDLPKTIAEAKLPIAAEPYHNYRGAMTEEGFRLMDYWRAVRKRLWLVIGIAVLMTTLAAIYMSRRPDIFEARARVQVDLEQVNPELVSSERRSAVVNTDPAYFNTQLQNLNSPSLLRRVALELDLENNKEFVTAKSDDSRSGLRGLLRALGLASEKKNSSSDEAVQVATSSVTTSKEDLAEARRLAPYVEALQRNITVEPVREGRSAFKETRLIDIYYRHTNPVLAAQIVNTISDVFTRSNQEKRSGTSGKTNKFLQERLAELQGELKRDEELIARISRSNAILKVDEDKTVALERLQGLNKQLLEAQNVRKIAESQYKTASEPGALSALSEDSTARKFIDETTFEINKLQQERERLAIEFTDEAPEIKEKDRSISVLTKKLEEYRSKNRDVLLQNLRTRFEQARDQESKIQAEYNNQYNLAQVQNEAGINLKLVEQRRDTNKGLLDSLLKQVRENDIAAVGTENNISLVDTAIPSEDPVAPRRLLTVMMAFVFSLIFGCGLALFLEYLDDTIRTTDEVENLLRVPALAVIPTIDALPRRKLLVAGEDGNKTGRSELLISNDSRSALAEAYRQLRTSVLLSTAGHAPKSLLVTSSVPSEGKTTTAINTAISLAQTGAKVCIIDADMRRPRLHGIFQISNEHGLSSILSNQMEEEEILDIIQHDETTNLYLLPSGAVPPNPAELIGSEQMRRLLQTMEANFTHVVVDSPPIASFTDGVLISTMVDGVLLVVHSGKSSRQIVKRARQLLQEVGAKLFGVVLNKVNTRSNDNHYYYQNYYNSYYADADKE